MSTRRSQNKSHLLHEALSWSIFFSWSRSRERGWSRTVKVHPSFRNWSSSWFCGSLRGFCSGPTDFCMHRSHSSFGVKQIFTAGKFRLYLLVPLYLCDQQEFVEQEQVDVDQLCVLWEWTDTNNVVRLFQTFKSQSLSNVWQLRCPRAPVSTSFPSCSRLLWEIRFSRVTAFKRCFRVCRTVNIESTLVVMC